MSSQPSTTSAIRHPPPSIRVTNWPLRDDPLRGWGVFATVVVAAIAAAVMSRSAPMGLLTAGAMFAAAWRSLLPVTFDLRARGVVQTCWRWKRQLPWTQIARFEERPRGILLHRDRDTSPVSLLQATYIPWRGQRDQILALLEFYTSRAGAPGSTIHRADSKGTRVSE